jgi:hypothetical protein
MEETTSTADTRVCEWCAEKIAQKAVKCPKCTKWRKDIDQDRIKFYTWSGGAPAFPFFIYMIGSIKGWWREGGFFDSHFSFGAFFGSASGLLVVAGVALSIWFSYVYYARVSKKIGSWWWF